MRAGFYPKLAWEGIRKNNKLYFPYILTGSVMVMMYYILSYLIESPALAQMPGGSVLMMILPLGCIVIAFFSVLFLFYTNSFLIRQRYREFGLYNILGMDKRNIRKIMVWESIFVCSIVLITGLTAGIVLSKAAELVLLNLLKMEVSFDLHLGMTSLRQTPMVFGGIYLLLLINSLVKVSSSKPLELMKSNMAGDRVPRYTGLFALAGVILLAAAYYLAVSIQEPLTALFWFFIAVLLVIAGTYLILISGSVTFCRLLQKNKNYYYKPNHFVSVSSMVYRMKRNGAGLASICILLTMVLVMISSTASLYFGEENSLNNQYPNSVNISLTYSKLEGIEDENLDSLRSMIRTYSGPDADLTGVRTCEAAGLITEDGITINLENLSSFSTAAVSYDNVGYLSVISLDDYNDRMDADETLAEHECFVYCNRLTFDWTSFAMEYGDTYQVKRQLDTFKEYSDTIAMVSPTVYLVVKDPYAFIQPVKDIRLSNGSPLMVYNWRCGFDMDTEEAERLAVRGIRDELRRLASEENSTLSTLSVQSREAQRDTFYDLFGSLFFLGIMLSIVFLMAAVLIIYYKQLSEGYEDRSRFEIMQKVGMTKRDIRSSINSQMLTVFFLPLLLAGIHLGFAFPFISKILLLFGFNNRLLNIMINLGCFAVFGVFYALVYKITSNVYFSIVSSRKESSR